MSSQDSTIEPRHKDDTRPVGLSANAAAIMARYSRVQPTSDSQVQSQSQTAVPTQRTVYDSPKETRQPEVSVVSRSVDDGANISPVPRATVHSDTHQQRSHYQPQHQQHPQYPSQPLPSPLPVSSQSVSVGVGVTSPLKHTHTQTNTHTRPTTHALTTPRVSSGAGLMYGAAIRLATATVPDTPLCISVDRESITVTELPSLTAHTQDRRTVHPALLIFLNATHPTVAAQVLSGDTVIVMDPASGHCLSAPPNQRDVVAVSSPLKNGALVNSSVWQISSPHRKLKDPLHECDVITLRNISSLALHYSHPHRLVCNSSHITENALWEVLPSHLPVDMTWLKDIAASVASPSTSMHSGVKVEGTTTNDSEAALCDSLLSALSGAPSDLIACATVKVRSGDLPHTLSMTTFKSGAGEVLDVCVFSVTQAIFPSLAAIASPLLPLASALVFLRSEVVLRSQPVRGLCSQAFAAALSSLLRDVAVAVAQLEGALRTSGLTVLQICQQMRPIVTLACKLAVLLCNRGEKEHVLVGGPLLTQLHEAVSSEGDEYTRTVMLTLLTKATVPYLSMVQHWSYHGELRDTHHEFMVSSNPTSQHSSDRFVLNVDRIPVFLLPVAQFVLHAGRALSIVREYTNKPIAIPHELRKPLVYAPSARSDHPSLEQAHNVALSMACSLLRNDLDLLGRLKSIRRYLLLSQGEFIDLFLELAWPELCKEAGEASVPRMRSLLEVAKRGSNAHYDPHKNSLTCRLDTRPLAQQPRLKALEVFEFQYSAQWPLSMILSKNSLAKYQILFKHLFYCRHVERQLSTCFIALQSFKSTQLQRALARSNALRHRMLHFVSTLGHYMLTCVIDRHWQQMHTSIHNAKSVDEMVAAHTLFLDQCLLQCLASPDNTIHQTKDKVLTYCIIFADNIQKFITSIEPTADELENATRLYVEVETAKRLQRGLNRAPLSESEIRSIRCDVQTKKASVVILHQHYQDMIDKFSTSFDDKLKTFLLSTRERSMHPAETHLADLLTRLDFNDFYTGYFG